MAEIMKGAPAAETITRALILRAEALKRRGLEPCLAILRVGERPDDLAYEHSAVKRCEKIDIHTVLKALPADCGQEALLAAIRQINEDERIHGCLMLRPLPPHLDEDAVCEALKPGKDVDGMTAGSLKTVFTGRGEGFAPCSAQSCIELLDHYGVDPAGKRAVVIGRSLVIGRPVSMMLEARNATVTMCHSGTRELPAVCREAEILIAAAGQAGMVDAGFTNPRQIILDVGVNAAPQGGICGDVCFDRVAPLVRAVSPVPGGVGALTAAVLCKHVIEAAEKAAGEKDARSLEN